MPFPCHQGPRVLSTLVCSLSVNEIGAEGAKHISEGLKENKTLTYLE